MIALKLLFYVDMFIRLHIQYYNSDGILITHPLMTAKHYIKTSFVSDFLGAFPFSNELGFHRLFYFKSAGFNETLMCFVTLTFQLYRVTGFITYIQGGMSWSNAIKLEMFKYVLVLIVLMGFLANFHALYICVLPSAGTFRMICPKWSWIVNSGFQKQLEPAQVFVASLYSVLINLTASALGTFKTNNEHEVIATFVIFAIGVPLRIYYLAKMAAYGVST